ncbi:DUF881 domain-containing protein [Nocardioides currus]|uniref:DUF881 domain-containing protein n=1 Tax=Nocardioides currus TaxID=2133958 RepID=A0A2R7YSG5_9ACTN|nr:DUF881 domain-containing protein [Nocardioides currus]PUA79253.1 hypothetical protein C7S10_19675 [Nocardioides currus]
MPSHSTTSTTDAPLPHHVTTPLLTLITERSLDEDYAHVAMRRAAAGGPPPRRSRLWSTAVAVAAFGALATVVAVQTSRDADVQELGRTALIRQIESERSEVADLQKQIRTLTDARLAADELNGTLDEQSADLTTRLQRLEVRTGYVPVRGPGVRFKVASAPNAVPNDEVRDEDLALLVDGLWAAGAEAVAINDQRVVALGGIRNTSRAIHVNGRPLTPPYVIEAIGDQGTLQARLLESGPGLAFFGLVNSLGFSYVAQNVDDLRLPAASLRALRQATEMTTTIAGGPDEEGATP